MEEGNIEDANSPIHCDLCNEPNPPLHCEECQCNVCLACVGKHLSDLSKDHKVVPYQKQGSIPKYIKCQSHASERCELHCQRCDLPVCNTCLLSNAHKGHTLTELMEVIRSKKEVIEKDFEEIQQIIYPKYEEILVQLKTDQLNVDSYFEDLAEKVTKQGQEWHVEVDRLVSKLHHDILAEKRNHIASFQQQEENIASTISEIKQSIQDLKRILDLVDFYLTAVYKSKNAVFNRFPEKLSFPSFLPKKIDTGHLSRQFGVFTTESRCSFQSNLLLKSLNTIETFESGHSRIHGLACLSEYEIWIIGSDNSYGCDSGKGMKLFSTKGELLRSKKAIDTPVAIAVTKNGDLMYADDHGNIKIVEYNQIKEVISLKGWKVLDICSTLSGDLLVIMNDYKNSSKVVRYCGSTEKQTIQFNDDGQSLYSPGGKKYLAENKNFDICVADHDAHAVVVVNQDGKLRYRYTGQTATEESFDPVGIATDSQSRVLIAADKSRRIHVHVLDQEGTFLSIIKMPMYMYSKTGLCVDINDCLLVADSNKVYKIKYCT
ncbi:uncharacterized protein LOC128170770 [Crassostrea angulata]|uniref:uncharacterized protein LOC128170770 n=1 Tax=Magallana angulata TaxID=2784310 RepID=UPI0022B08892|nr:uncharacterized protein LOC128170770 [Crassostrea angulata]XP_052692501.1 uncharacterized protein LOC128170770 [Crassostrea angulata]